MLNFKNEYFTLEKGRTKYPTQFKDKSFLVVYGSKEGGITGTELTAHIYKIPENYYEINAGQLDFSNYPNGIENDFLTIRVTNLDSLFSLPLNFTDWKDISPENLTTTFEKIGVSILDIQKRLSEVAVYIDSGKPDQINLPKLPVGCTWYKGQDENIVALPISDLYGKFQQMIDSLHKTIKDLLDIDYTNLSDELREETDKLLKELEDLKKQCVLDVTKEGEKQLEILNQASAGLPNRVKAIEKDIADFKAENETQHNELKGEIRTARTENIPAERLVDNSLSAKKLKTATDDDKIKLANLSDEVKKAMTGSTPVSPTLEKDSVVREYIANEAVNASKLDNSMFHKEYLLNINKASGQIQFKIDKLNLTTSDIIEIEWLSKQKTNYVFQIKHGSGTGRINGELSIKEILGTYINSFKGNPVSNYSGVSLITYGDGGSGRVYNFNGAYYDFIIKVNGKNIDFTFNNTSEEISLVDICEKAAIDYETALNLANSKKPVLAEFSDEEKTLILGKATDEYEVCIEKLKSTQNFIENKIAIPNIRLKAGKYKIVPYATKLNFIIYAFPTARGGKILQKFELNNIPLEGIEIIINSDSYVGMQGKENSGRRIYWFGVGTTYRTNFFSTTATHKVGEVLLVNEGDGAVSSRDSYTCPLQFELTEINSLTTNSNSQEIEDIKKIYTDKLNNIASFDINNIPSENKQILYRIEDLKDILYNDDFIYSKNINNVMTDSSIFIHTPYQAIDEFTYRVKFKLNNINSKFGITAYKGEFENGAWMIDTTTKTLNFINAVSPTFVQNLNLDYQFEDRIGYSDLPTILNIEGIEFQANNVYILEIVRSGLIMTLNIYDIKNDKTFSKEIPNSRFHGGKGFFVQEGEIEVIYAEEKTPLTNGAKAIFIGDSITEGLSMGTTDISKRWCSLLRDIYFKGNALCSGMGWGTTSNVLSALNGIKSYCNYIKYYFIMIGTNQSAADGVGFEKWAKEIVVIYDKIKKELGGIPIIVCPPLRKNTDSKILQMRDFILEKGWDTIRMDIATSTGNGITFDSSLSTDGVHFNVNGNQKMYERALVDLKKIM